MEKRKYSNATRMRMAENGQAMKDGSFPIKDQEDLENAIQSVGRASDYDRARRHIMRRAKAMGLNELLPDEWNTEKLWGGSIAGLLNWKL